MGLAKVSTMVPFMASDTQRTLLRDSKPYGDFGGGGSAMVSPRTPVALRTRGNSTTAGIAVVKAQGRPLGLMEFTYGCAYP